jgi:REP element-mobilizing transposase RayT
MRKDPLVTGEFYHVYNRGVDKRLIFNNFNDLERFFQSMSEFNSLEPIGSIYQNSFGGQLLRRPTSKLVEFVAYSLNSNHYHFLLKQVTDNGISEFMKRLGGGYTRYFNEQYKRNGSLFQGRFKSILVDSNEYLLHLSAYINLNDKQQKTSRRPIMSKTSWKEYTGETSNNICKKNIIIDQFKNLEEYKTFARSSLQDIIARKALFGDLD